MNITKIIISALLLAGVNLPAAEKLVGTVGGVKFYRIRSHSFAGPNGLLFVSQDKDGKVEVAASFGNPGIGVALIGAAGEVGGAATLGALLRPSVSNQSISGGNSTSEGGTSVAVAEGGNAISKSTSTSSSKSTSSASAKSDVKVSNNVHNNVHNNIHASKNSKGHNNHGNE